MKHKIITLLFFALALSLLFASCGDAVKAPAPTDSVAETAAPKENAGLAYAGSYDDTWSMRAHMDVTYVPETDRFTVQIIHGDSAEVSYEWIGSAVFDEAARAFVCSVMTGYRLTATESGEIETEEVAHYTDVTLPVADDGSISVPSLNTNYRFVLPTTD